MLKYSTFLLVVLIGLCPSVFAIPALQLGPGALGNWVYDAGTQTWVTDTNPFEVNAYANSDGAAANGAYAWDPAGAASQTAYFIVAGVPMTNTDAFDVTVMNDGGALTLVSSGYGTPPIEDPNSLAPHGIFDTWFEIYEFNFDGAATTISDQQPGETGTGEGFVEAIAVTINSLAEGVTGVHMDLFTVSGDGDLANAGTGNGVVNAFAPFSHDAEYEVPEPMSLAIWSLLGIVGAVVWSGKGKNA